MKSDQDEGEQLELSTFSCFCDNILPTSNSLPECGAPGLDRMRFSRLLILTLESFASAFSIFLTQSPRDLQSTSCMGENSSS